MTLPTILGASTLASAVIDVHHPNGSMVAEKLPHRLASHTARESRRDPS